LLSIVIAPFSLSLTYELIQLTHALVEQRDRRFVGLFLLNKMAD